MRCFLSFRAIYDRKKGYIQKSVLLAKVCVIVRKTHILFCINNVRKLFNLSPSRRKYLKANLYRSGCGESGQHIARDGHAENRHQMPGDTLLLQTFLYRLKAFLFLIKQIQRILRLGYRHAYNSFFHRVYSLVNKRCSLYRGFLKPLTLQYTTDCTQWSVSYKVWLNIKLHRLYARTINMSCKPFFFFYENIYSGFSNARKITSVFR